LFNPASHGIEQEGFSLRSPRLCGEQKRIYIQSSHRAKGQWELLVIIYQCFVL